MRLRIIAFTVGLLMMLTLTGCGSEGSNDASRGDDEPTAAVTQPPAPATQPPSPPQATTSPDDDAREVVGTVVRFSSNTTSVDVTIGEDNRAVRDFLSMLPLTLTFEEFSGREKISFLPRELRHRGSPGSTADEGDLIYYVPWGNLGFFYNAEGSDYSDDTIHLGTFDGSLDQLERLEGEVRVRTTRARPSR